MVINNHDRGYSLDYMDEEDLRSLRSLIKSGGLMESRKWYSVKKEIDGLLRDK